MCGEATITRVKGHEQNKNEGLNLEARLDLPLANIILSVVEDLSLLQTSLYI